jgi:hydrogenase assembly chaperone HypC/HupF
MCLTAPVRVIDVTGTTATVDAAGRRRTASTLAVPGIRPGDWALLSAGTLVRVIDPALAAEIADAFRTATGEQP